MTILPNQDHIMTFSAFLNLNLGLFVIVLLLLSPYLHLNIKNNLNEIEKIPFLIFVCVIFE